MTVRQRIRGWVTGGSTPASTDDIMAAVTLLGRKTDTLIAQIGIVMTQQDEVNAAVAALGQAVTDLTTTVEAEIDPHQPGVTAGWVDPAGRGRRVHDRDRVDADPPARQRNPDAPRCRCDQRLSRSARRTAGPRVP